MSLNSSLAGVVASFFCTTQNARKHDNPCAWHGQMKHARDGLLHPVLQSASLAKTESHSTVEHAIPHGIACMEDDNCLNRYSACVAYTQSCLLAVIIRACLRCVRGWEHTTAACHHMSSWC
eukprot:m.284040 g.284040  ORF g.284040 m.284040 type:complete len:121 (-) comp15761_c0_seq8:368-730(-)